MNPNNTVNNDMLIIAYIQTLLMVVETITVLYQTKAQRKLLTDSTATIKTIKSIRFWSNFFKILIISISLISSCYIFIYYDILNKQQTFLLFLNAIAITFVLVLFIINYNAKQFLTLIGNVIRTQGEHIKTSEILLYNIQLLTDSKIKEQKSRKD